MPADEGAGGSAVDPVETTDGLLRDERGIVYRDSGIVVTHTVSAVSDTAVRYQLVDPLPGKVDVEEIDFDPAYEPPHGRIDAHAAVISGVVEPGREQVVRYGLRPSEPGGPPDLGELQRTTQASIELSEPVDEDATADADLDAASMARGESAVASGEAATEGFYFGIKRLMFGGDESSEAGAPATGDDDRPESRTTASDASEDDTGGEADQSGDDDGAPDDETQAGDPRVPGGDPFGGTSEDASLAASISEIESTVERSNRDEGTDASDDEPAEQARPFREFFEVREDTESPAEARRGESDLVDELVRQLESGDLADDQRQALGEALADVLPSADRPTKSTDVRLREIESKLEEFDAYRNALKELIDVHGPAEEFLGAVRGDVEALNAAVDDIRGDLAAAASARAGLDDRLEELADEVALLDSRVKRLRNRVDDVEVAHESEVGTLDASVDAIESELDRVDQLESEVRSLRDALEQERSRRRAVVEALRDDEPPGE